MVLWEGDTVGYISDFGLILVLLKMQLAKEAIILGVCVKCSLHMLVVDFHSRSGLHFIIEGGAVDIPRCFGSGLAAVGGNNRANSL